MPLVIEVLDHSDQWQQVNYILAGEIEGSLSDFSILSGPQVYLFGCSDDDTSSYIRRSVRGHSVVTDGLRLVVPEGGCLPIANLHDGEMHTIQIHPDGSLAQRTIRFRHVYLDFGTRECPICSQSIPALEFGRHFFDHPAPELSEDIGGLLDVLLDSVNQSLEIARDFPRLTVALRVSRNAISELKQAFVATKAKYN